MGISVKIAVGETVGSTTVQVEGSDVIPATDVPADEWAQLNLSDPNGLVAAYWGAFPSSVYYSDPCNDGQNWFATYGWQPVTITRRATGATIRSVDTRPTVASTQTFENGSKHPIEANPSLSATVTNSVSSTSTKAQAVTLTQEISYDISFLGTGGGGATSLSYQASWETSYTKTAEESFTLTSSVSIPLDPGEKVVADLMLLKGTITIDVTYLLSLSGRVAAGYYHEYKGHHIFGFDVNTLLSNANCPTTVLVTETLKIDFYADASIVVRNVAGEIVHVESRGVVAAPLSPSGPQVAAPELVVADSA